MNNIKWITLQANWVGYYKDIVSNELCDKILDYSNNIKQLENRIEMDDGWFRSGEQYYNEIKDCFMVALKKYQEKHHDCLCQKYTDFRLNKYSEGGFMSRHIDFRGHFRPMTFNMHDSHEQTHGYPQLTAILMLNDDYKGGNLLIADNEYETVKGSAIVFPSNFMFPHEVKKVEKGTRYSIVTWLM